jgi:arylsulfatase A-like enzyme
MPAAQHRPNIVFVVLDTHRVDRLGCYGYTRNTTPNLDTFARDATVFENAISPAQWTVPSHASMFSGEPPSAHMALHASNMLDACFRTLAERLRASGYRTIGFCNNPLVGIVNNGLKRGFDLFYNYSGAIRSVPAKETDRKFAPLLAARERFTQILRKISYPIQNAFANSAHHFHAAVNPFWVPLWTRFGRFKGNTAGSIRDAATFVRQQSESGDGRPWFMFINLMEAHHPLSAPDRFAEAFIPDWRQGRAARDFMQSFTAHAVEWLTPLDKPLPEWERRTLSGMYDAEIAYQDHLLAQLLVILDSPECRKDTMVIFVADHGEMLGEHGMMGHGFGVYQELIHVPLMIRFPGQTTGRRVPDLVSTTRLFHTALDAARFEAYETSYSPAVDIRSQSLIRVTKDTNKARPAVFAEAYAPAFTFKLVERHKPDLLKTPYFSATHRAAYEGDHKLIHVENVRDELYALDNDPGEMLDLIGVEQALGQHMLERLELFVEKAVSRRPENWSREEVDLDNEIVQQRLRELGYVE